MDQLAQRDRCGLMQPLRLLDTLRLGAFLRRSPCRAAGWWLDIPPEGCAISLFHTTRDTTFSDDALEFFYEHSDPEVEGQHVEMGTDLLARRIRTEADAVKAQWAARFTLIGIQDFYRRIHDHMMSGAAA